MEMKIDYNKNPVLNRRFDEMCYGIDTVEQTLDIAIPVEKEEGLGFYPEKELQEIINNG